MQSLAATTPEQSFQDVIISGEWRFVVVASHDCEFNEAKRNRFLVARVEDVPGNLTPEQRVALRESNDVNARAEAEETVAGVDSFLLDPVPGAFDQESVAVFTMLLPFPMRLKDEFVSKKRAELEHDHRERFRAKLAWFFGRVGEDIDDDLKFDRP
jgi:hypothetical protein